MTNHEKRYNILFVKAIYTNWPAQSSMNALLRGGYARMEGNGG